MATYPTAVKSFTSKTDFTDSVLAADVNTLQDEVNAIESAVGVSPALSASSMTGGWDATTSKNWSTVKSRLDNIERGVVGDSHGSLYVHQAGGDTIQSSASVIPLTLQGRSGGTVDLFRVRDGNGTTRIAVDYNNGQIYQSGYPVPFRISQGKLPIDVNAGSTAGSNTIIYSGFSVPPQVYAILISQSGASSAACVRVQNITTTTALLILSNLVSTGSLITYQLFWLAIQGLRTSSDASL